VTYALIFVASGAVVVLAGAALARYADAIAEATKLGRLWIGAVLLAGATSLPELSSDVAAVRLGATDLAVGDLFGSSLANMLILAIVDLVPPRRQVLQHAALDHALGAALAITLNAFAAVLVIVRPAWTLLSVSWGSLALFLAYLAGTRAVYRHTLREGAPRPADERAGAGAVAGGVVPLRRAAWGFAGAAVVVLAVAPVFAWSAKGIAAVTGLGNTFVGTWFVGLATSLPELVTSLSAVRLGAFDLAVGNLFGSNAFNMAIFFALDLVEPGSLFAALDPSHALSGLFAVVLMSLGLAAIVYRAKRRFAMLEPDSLLMLAGYCFAIWSIFTHTAGR
jgi:cation:H+ antiporter